MRLFAFKRSARVQYLLVLITGLSILGPFYSYAGNPKSTSCGRSLGSGHSFPQPGSEDLSRLADLDAKMKAQPEYEKISLEVEQDLKEITYKDKLKLHRSAGVISLGYFFTSLLFDYKIQFMRDYQHISNFLTLHYSNFFLGIGFISVTDHFLSGINPEKNRNLALLKTSILFTFANWMFEIGPWAIRTDWTDFYAGQAGLITYVALTKAIERVYWLQTKSTPKL